MTMLQLKVQSTADLLTFIRRCKSDVIDFYYTNGITYIIEVNPSYVRGIKIPSSCTEDVCSFTITSDVLKALYTSGNITFNIDGKELTVSNVNNNVVSCKVKIGAGDSFSHRYSQYIVDSLKLVNTELPIPPHFRELSSVLASPINYDAGLVNIVTQSGYAIMAATDFPVSLALSGNAILTGMPKVYAIKNPSGSLWYGYYTNEQFCILTESHGYSNVEYKKLFDLSNEALYSCQMNVSSLSAFINRNKSSLVDIDFTHRVFQCTCAGVTYDVPFTVLTENVNQHVKFENVKIPSEILTKVLPIFKESQFQLTIYPYTITITLASGVRILFR